MPNNPLRALRRLLPNPPVEDDPRRALRLMSPGYAGSDLATQLVEDEPQIPLGGQPIGGPAPTPVSQLPRNPLREIPPQDAMPQRGTPEYEQAQAGAMQVQAGARPQRALASSERDYQNRVAEYEPKDEGWGKTALRMGIGFAIGGPAGAGLPLLNRKRADENWKKRELSQSIGLEQEQAQTDALRNPLRQTRAPIYRTRTDEKGNKIRQKINPETGAATDEIGPDGKPVMEQLAPVKSLAERRPVRQADEQGNEYWANAETGEPLLDAKGGIRYVKRAAGAKGEPDREVGGRMIRRQPDGSYQTVYESPEKPGQEKPDYKTRADWNYKKQAEAEAAAKDLRGQAEKADVTTYAGQQLQADLLKRAGEAEKSALDYRDKGDIAATEASGSAGATNGRRGAVKPGKDGKYHYTLEQIKAHAIKIGESYEAVLRQLRADKRAVIDE